MITLALGQCVWGLAYRWNSLTGGDNGINLRERPKFGGIDLANEMTFFFLVFAVFCVSLLLMYTLVRSPFGRSLAGIRERELRMKILGYNTWLHKYIAFIIAGAFGGLSGVLWAHTAGIVSPVNVELPTSVDALLMAVLGGSGTLVGGVIGTFIVFGLREYLSTLVPWWQYVLGVVYVLTILYLPTGLMGIPERLRQRRRRNPAIEKSRRNWHPRPPERARKPRQQGSEDNDKHIATAAQSAAAGRQRCARPDRDRAAPRNCASAMSRRPPASSPRSARTWSTASRCISTRRSNKLGGADVKFIVEDEQGKPDTAVTKAKKLILQDKVHMFVGGLLASTGYALAPVSTAEKVRLRLAGLGGRRPDPARPAEVSVFHPHRLVELAAEPSVRPMGLRAGLQEDRRDRRRLRVRLRGGRRLPARVRGLRRTRSSRKSGRRSAPRTSGLTSRPSRPTPTRSSSLMVGPMSLQFPKQLAASGNKKPVIGGGTSYDEFVLPSMGDEVIGHVSALQYSAALDTPKNAAFVKAYRAKYGKVPSYYSETNYTTAQMIDEVIKKTGGKFPGAEEFIKQLAAMKFDTLRGPVSIDEMRNPVQNIYIKKVEKKKMFGYDKDELWNTVIKTYPNVNQFGQFKKAEFLATPVYSRDYPPCKFCN